MIRPQDRLALYMEGAFSENTGKMGLGCLRYSPFEIVAIVDSETAGKNAQDVTGIPRDVPIVATLEDAVRAGANVLVLGIAPPGGLIPDSWRPVLARAVEVGLSLVNGLHEPLAPQYSSLAQDQFIWDIRQEPKDIGVGSGAARELKNRRVLMIGTDMNIGKMTAGLEIQKLALDQGVNAAFVTTGQIGITITGRGIPLDAIRIDFAAGAVEREVLAAADSDLVIIEGQGSLLHPGSSANLPLLRGSCPTHLVLCHRAGMTHLPRLPWVQVPPLKDVISLYQDLAEAGGNLPRPVAAGIALNTSGLSEPEAEEAIASIVAVTGLPVCDPIRQGPKPLLDSIRA